MITLFTFYYLLHLLLQQLFRTLCLKNLLYCVFVPINIFLKIHTNVYYGQRFRKLLYLLKTSAKCVLLLGPPRSQKDLFFSSLFLINPFFKALSNIWGLYVMSTFFLCKELQKFVYSVIWSIHIMANYIFMWA